LNNRTFLLASRSLLLMIFVKRFGMIMIGIDLQLFFVINYLVSILYILCLCYLFILAVQPYFILTMLIICWRPRPFRSYRLGHLPWFRTISQIWQFSFMLLLQKHQSLLVTNKFFHRSSSSFPLWIRRFVVNHVNNFDIAHLQSFDEHAILYLLYTLASDEINVILVLLHPTDIIPLTDISLPNVEM